MVTGVECASLVLAVLPLFIEASKAYSDGVETILNVSLVSRRDAKLSDFYDEFYWAVSELGEHITDMEVRSGLYSNVIQPLEKELEHISQTLPSNPRTVV